MKHMKILSAILLAVVMVCALCACGVELGGEETWTYSAEDKEGTDELFHNFFEETFAATNLVVTADANGESMFTETIDGTSEFVDYPVSGAKTWSFIKDGEYIYALTGDGSNYYMVGEEYYGYGHLVYKNTIDLFEMLPEEGLTFACEVSGSAENGKSSEKLTMSIENDEGTIKIDAEKEDGLVRTITMFRREGENETTITMTLAYGAAAVEIPDISGMSKVEY